MSFDEPKKRRYLTVTETGWVSATAIAKELGCSISDLLEKIGRHEILVTQRSVKQESKNQSK
jgi:hypothetical protein